MDLSSILDLASRIKQKESNGNYSVTNPDSGAIGAYQIMPENYKPWASEAGVDPSDYSPEAQDRIAQFKMSQYADKYGIDKVPQIWYAGEGSLNYSNDALNRPQGEYPSINSYTSAINGASQGSNIPSTPYSSYGGRQQVNMTNPITKEILARISGLTDPQKQPLVLGDDFYNKIQNRPMVNEKQASQNSLMNSMPILQKLFEGGMTDNARASVSPIINKMVSGQMDADVNQAQLDNLQTKQRTATDILKMMPQMKNPMEYQELLGLLDTYTGQKISPATSSAYFTTPEDTNKLLASVAGQQMSAETSKYGHDLSYSAQMQQIQAQKDIALGKILAKSTTQQIDPNLLVDLSKKTQDLAMLNPDPNAIKAIHKQNYLTLEHIQKGLGEQYMSMNGMGK